MEELYHVLGAASKLQDSEDVDPAAEFRRYRCCEISRMQQWVYSSSLLNRTWSPEDLWMPSSFAVAECAGCGLTYTLQIGPSRCLKHYHMGGLPLKDRPWDTEEECETWAKRNIESHRDLLNENVIKFSDTIMTRSKSKRGGS